MWNRREVGGGGGGGGGGGVGGGQAWCKRLDLLKLCGALLDGLPRGLGGPLRVDGAVKLALPRGELLPRGKHSLLHLPTAAHAVQARLYD